MLFFPMLMISLMMILISNSWFSMWMIMEINLLSFIMLLIFDKNLNNDLLMNYFLIQSFNSYLFLMSSFMLNYFNNMIMFFFILNFSLLTKMGMPPFYYWYLKMMKNLNWYNLIYMSTFQKIIPLYTFLMLMNFNLIEVMLLNFMILMFYSIFLSLIGLNQMNLKLLMSYSSIIQMSWIIIIMYMNEYYSMMYYLIYLLISLNMMLMFNMMNLNNLNDLMYMKMKNNLMYLYYMFMMFSLSGIPPMFGFLMKWLSLQLMTNFLNFYLLMMLLLSSLVSMFFYMRMMFNNFLNYNFSMKINLKFINYFEINFNFFLLNWIMLIMLLFYEII
uniref:NADH-ubiquinone oxidoreductase chain 2 n=1 Tax=Pseudoligosita yasumatsui TaxID=3067466 RepID=A0AA49KED5_9HYME|nr:NADH dehydrogenase subunit 2 [Pseudoligosita yasumatsui]WLF85671.1 NADH dehydrogenase subunit 2 [Pseudoligosita yasumatsui]